MRFQPFVPLLLAVFHAEVPEQETQSGEDAVERQKRGRMRVLALRTSIQINGPAARNKATAMSLRRRDQKKPVSSSF
jgi:hypothetical protein